MSENIKQRIIDYFFKENIPESGYIARLESDTRDDDRDWDYAIINQLYVSVTYPISHKSGLKSEKVAYEIVYPDGYTDIILYPEFDDIEDGHYQCPECDSTAVFAEDRLSGKVYCSKCEWHNHNMCY